MGTGIATTEKEQEALVVWLDSLADWDVFFTGTTRYRASCRSLKKSFERFMSNNYSDISYVYSLEPHGHGGFHVHSMFDSPYVIRWRDFWQKWYARYGRAKTEPMRHKADCELYVAKYVIKQWGNDNQCTTINKDKEIWWDVQIKNRNFKRKRSLAA